MNKTAKTPTIHKNLYDAVVENVDSIRCFKCGIVSAVYLPDEDAYWCAKCDEYAEKPCSDKTCEFCKTDDKEVAKKMCKEFGDIKRRDYSLSYEVVDYAMKQAEARVYEKGRREVDGTVGSGKQASRRTATEIFKEFEQHFIFNGDGDISYIMDWNKKDYECIKRKYLKT